ncbi:hypothetical protein ACOME3_005667 [Neoechinorhynchus agilis]
MEAFSSSAFGGDEDSNFGTRNRFLLDSKEKAISMLLNELKDTISDVLAEMDARLQKPKSIYAWLKENSTAYDIDINRSYNLPETRVAELSQFCKDVSAKLCTPIIYSFRNDVERIVASIDVQIKKDVLVEMIVSIFRQSVEDIVTVYEHQRFVVANKLPKWFSTSTINDQYTNDYPL